MVPGFRGPLTNPDPGPTVAAQSNSQGRCPTPRCTGHQGEAGRSPALSRNCSAAMLRSQITHRSCRCRGLRVKRLEWYARLIISPQHSSSDDNGYTAPSGHASGQARPCACEPHCCSSSVFTLARWTMKRAVLVIGHGTRDSAGTAEFRDFVRTCAPHWPDRRVESCFLELADPPILPALDAAIAVGGGDIVVAPAVLLGADRHRRGPRAAPRCDDPVRGTARGRAPAPAGARRPHRDGR
jgi:hypothetical protein